MSSNAFGAGNKVPYMRMEEQAPQVLQTYTTSFNLNPSPVKGGVVPQFQYAPVSPAHSHVPQMPYVIERQGQMPLYASNAISHSNVQLAPGEMLITPGQTHGEARKNPPGVLRPNLLQKERTKKIIIAVVVFLLGLSLIIGAGLLAMKIKNKNTPKRTKTVKVATVQTGSTPKSLPATLKNIQSSIKNKVNRKKAGKKDKKIRASVAVEESPLIVENGESMPY